MLSRLKHFPIRPDKTIKASIYYLRNPRVNKIFKVFMVIPTVLYLVIPFDFIPGLPPDDVGIATGAMYLFTLIAEYFYGASPEDNGGEEN